MDTAQDISMDAAKATIWSQRDGILTLKEEQKLNWSLFLLENIESLHSCLAFSKSLVKHSCG